MSKNKQMDKKNGQNGFENNRRRIEYRNITHIWPGKDDQVDD